MKKIIFVLGMGALSFGATPSQASISISERGRCGAAALLATTFGPAATVGFGCMMMADVS